MYLKQFNFQMPTAVTLVHLDGSEERVTYGAYEGIMYSHANGWPNQQTVILLVPFHPVHEITRHDGVRIKFDNPPFNINEKGYGPND